MPDVLSDYLMQNQPVMYDPNGFLVPMDLPGVAPAPSRLMTGGALGQAGLPAPAVGLGEHVQDYTNAALQYIRDVASGKAALEGPLMQNTYDPDRSFRENVLDPRAMAQAEAIGGGFVGSIGGFPRGLNRNISQPVPTLYHGAARPWAPEPGLPQGQFRTDRLLSGEGYHGEGPGGYVSEVNPAADFYRTTYGEPWPGQVLDARLAILREQGRPGESALDTIQRMYGHDATWIPDPKDWVRAAARYANFRPDIHQRGALYELQYPNAYTDEFLLWRENLARQPQYVQDALLRFGVEPGRNIPDNRASRFMAVEGLPWSQMRGEDIFRYMSLRKAEVEHRDLMLTQSRGDRSIAKLLEEQKDYPIKGTRYPADEAMNVGKYNYAIFTPEKLDVIKRLISLFGLGGTAAGAAAIGSEPAAAEETPRVPKRISDTGREARRMPYEAMSPPQRPKPGGDLPPQDQLLDLLYGGGNLNQSFADQAIVARPYTGPQTGDPVINMPRYGTWDRPPGEVNDIRRPFNLNRWEGLYR